MLRWRKRKWLCPSSVRECKVFTGLSLFRFGQNRLVVAPAVKDTDNNDNLPANKERDDSSSPLADDPQSRPDVIARFAFQRKCCDVLADRND